MDKKMIAGKNCYLLEHAVCPQTPIVYLGMGSGMEEMLCGLEKRIMKQENISCRVIAYEAEDWDKDFSPWPAAFPDGKRQFAGDGKRTLQWLEGQCIPEVKKLFGVQESVLEYLAGYSLAGLFSLWAYYESGRFHGAASCSGSLWFDGWSGYMEEKPLPSPGKVYLSLGKKEEKTRHPVMSQIGEATRQQYACCERQGVQCVLDWQNGGHFHQVDERLYRAIKWLLK